MTTLGLPAKNTSPVLQPGQQWRELRVSCGEDTELIEKEKLLSEIGAEERSLVAVFDRGCVVNCSGFGWDLLLLLA